MHEHFHVSACKHADRYRQTDTTHTHTRHFVVVLSISKHSALQANVQFTGVKYERENDTLPVGKSSAGKTLRACVSFAGRYVKPKAPQ